MEKILELATNSLPAWFIVAVVVFWFVGGKELADRVLKRDERRVYRKKVELELARLELEEEQLKKDALGKGVTLTALSGVSKPTRWRMPLSKVLRWTCIPIGFQFVFWVLPFFAANLQQEEFKRRAAYYAAFAVADAVMSSLWPLMLRNSVKDEVALACIAIATFMGAAILFASTLSILQTYGIIS